MAVKKSKKDGNGKSTATIGFEQKLWLAVDKLRTNMDAAEYKHVVLGLIFLKHISDTFEEHLAKLIAGEGDIRKALTDRVHREFTDADLEAQFAESAKLDKAIRANLKGLGF